MLSLAFGLSFRDLYELPGLQRIDQLFLAHVQAAEPGLHTELCAARTCSALDKKQHSTLLIALAPHLEDFISQLFSINSEVQTLQARHHELAPLYSVKRQFVQRKAMHQFTAEQAEQLDGSALEAELTQLFGETFTELTFAKQVSVWQTVNDATSLDLALRYAAWAALTPRGRERHRQGVLFKAPHKIDPLKLIPVLGEQHEQATTYRSTHLRERNGFALTDHGTDLIGGLDQAHYCIWCHKQGKDSCSTGLIDKKSTEGSAFKKSVFGVPLAGCPLEEKISEFHEVRCAGYAIGALALIAVDNPMVAATGHRICNDCMKSCIYQKQEPVDIPQSETRVLKDVLALPWGFEIYSLLTRWNPLNVPRPVPRASTNKKVLIVGMGPAGFTLAHHLLNDGHTVIGIDGLKIEPLPSELNGTAFQPIRDIATLYDNLDDRVMAGFGGVAEYGITVRWDKNFLKLIRLLLERRGHFALYGGVRFGGTFDATQAWQMGFDHIALCAGAGKPTVLDLPNGLARGVRTASDFLMALQLTGAAKRDSLANLQVRMPIVVIGGGLTAIDTATESLAYYPVQVEKFLARYEILITEQGEAQVQADWSEEDKQIAVEFIDHARALRRERERAQRENRPVDLLSLLNAWGGVTIAYRKRLIDSPSYTLNHEEVGKALEEGIRFAEGLNPLAVQVDRYGHACAVRFSTQQNQDQTIELPARTVLIAAGTQPNTVLAREDPTHFQLDGRYFQACDEQGLAVQPEKSNAKPRSPQVLLAKTEDDRYISFFGDLHPSYFGNVVKAMGSAKQAFPVISALLERKAPMSSLVNQQFIALLDTRLRATVHQVIRLTPSIVEVIVHAPLAAQAFAPGQFYRLQNYQTLSERIFETSLTMEGLALTGAWVDRNRGLVSTIVLEMGGSSDLCQLLKPGEPIVLMGPTGHPTEILSDTTVILVGGGLGNAVLLSIGAAFRQAKSPVLYFAGYKKIGDRYKTAEIEAAADVVVWCCDEAPGFSPSRPQDKTFIGNIVQAMAAYGSGMIGETTIAMPDADRLIVIGSDAMMAAVAKARRQTLAPYLKPGITAIGSINSPMQCMMKEICAQCLQPHIDPQSGKINYVFSCFNQDQALDRVDFSALHERLQQNALPEKLTALWIRRCLTALRREQAGYVETLKA